MAITIDATVAGEDTNSYVTAAVANAYYANTLREPTWDGYSDDDRARALIQATQQIEGLRLIGTVSDTLQALHFPRTIDLDEDGAGYIIPDAIEDATCEQALWLLKQQENPELLDRRELQQQGVQSISADGLTESYGGSRMPGFGAEATHLLQRYLFRTITVSPRD